MKSFSQYISEDLDNIQAYVRNTGVYSPRNSIELISGLVNPSREQLQGYLNKVKVARFILHNNRLHVFDANDAIHDDVLRAEHPEMRNYGDFHDRVTKMYDTENSLLGSFHVSSDPVGYHVGLSYYRPERKEWMENLLKTHSRTSHLISPETQISPWDM